jgi:5-methylcytosine-specific restriction endonuclease McrA
MEERDKQWNADHLLKHGAKQCQECGEEYTPNSGQGRRQKYCSKRCKERVKGRTDRAKGLHKGSYSRYTYIVLWLRARNEKSYTAPCFYCGDKLPPEVGRFVVEHKIPRLKLERTKEAMHDISNLVISCIPCNKLKGINDYKAFKTEMAGDSELDVPEHKGEEHPLEKGEGVL